ncbi:diguanylate cyclase domain-containing protein [Paenibacillus anseongense]|uniref:diguanylate cyclase domain-containing protein n=1 Tax=Paenibacillus anseongense TaxID=2682845 RepID=UPI003AF041EA
MKAETIVTASMGYASIEEGDTTDTLIKKADKAMYVTKKIGKTKLLDFRTYLRRAVFLCLYEKKSFLLFL